MDKKKNSKPFTDEELIQAALHDDSGTDAADAGYGRADKPGCISDTKSNGTKAKKSSGTSENKVLAALSDLFHYVFFFGDK